MLRTAKLTVADEIENASRYYHATFLRQIPRMYREIEEALPGHPIASFFRMGNWIGGDRDGNPNVSAETLKMALARQSETVLRFYLTEVHELGAELSISATLAPVTPEMRALAERSPRPQRPPQRRALPPRADRHVRAAGGHAAGVHRHRGAAPRRRAAGRLSGRVAAFLADLRVIEASLRSHHAGALIGAAPGAADAGRAGVRLPPRHGRPAPELRQARGGGRRTAAHRAHRGRLLRR